MTRANILKTLLTVPVLALVLTSCAQPGHDSGESELLAPIPSYGAAPLIRVKLSKPSEQSAVTVDAGKGTLNIDGKSVELDGPVTLSLTGGRVKAGAFGSGTSIEITPSARPKHFDVDGRIYRGRLRVVAGQGGWEAVNVVDLEQYVAGVVGWEMIAGWPVEALKAQAIASRTYALFEMEHARGNGRNWDVDDTTRYQVYGGVGPADNPKQWRETDNVLAAREGTTGEVLTYNGQGFRAFFHSTSGGHTVNPEAALGIHENIPPLAGVDLGEFDKDSPKAEWELRMDASEVKARLIENAISPSDVIRIEGADVADGGHAITLKLYDRHGRHKVINAITVRKALGLYSTNFTAEKNGNEWVFKGKGYGHGCGMCQWSARGMAKAGWDADKILHTMYPGAEIKRAY
ncbi:MAG: SpoIID/LytB domain-containing protein [Planctomycetes bacterium]|nr:SpoIID/LytB domain-containing protein [Planctomycetota bacterium]